MMNLRQASRDGLDRAISLFEKATNLDAHYARAHASLGYALELKGQFLSIPELTERAIGSFQRAIALEPMIPESYSGLGLAFSQLGQDDEAISHPRADLAPDQFKLGRHWDASTIREMFREAAVEYEGPRGRRQGWLGRAQMAQCYAYLGDYAKAEQAAGHYSSEATRARRNADRRLGRLGPSTGPLR
jgi:tetratricopeptide (TPR) repeat protein